VSASKKPVAKNTSRPAFIWERTGESSGRWLEAGTGRLLSDDGSFVVQIDRMPVNPEDWSGYTCVPLTGKLPTAVDVEKCERLERRTPSDGIVTEIGLGRIEGGG
jgi:hypothetical protein